MTNTISGQIQSNAATVDLKIDLNKSEIEFGFIEYWNQVKDRLPPELVKKAQKGGYREVRRDKVEKAAGGKNEFYRPVLIKFVSKFLETQPKQAIAYNDVTMIEGIETNTILANVYLEPDVTWKKNVPGIDSPITVRLPKLPEDLKSKVVNSELLKAQDNNVVLVPEPEGALSALGHVVAIDCNTTIDDKPWSDGCFVNNKWLLDEASFKIKDMLPALLNLKAGDDTTVSIIYPDGFGDVSGKTGIVKMRVNQIYKRDTPQIDDDLAITMGKKSLEQWKTELEAAFDLTLKQERQSAILNTILAELVNADVVDVEPVPSVWMLNKAHSIYSQNRNMFNTEEDMLNRFSSARMFDGKQVESKADLLAYFAEHAARTLVTDLILRSWGKKKGVAGSATLQNMTEYVNAVTDVLVGSAQIEEVDVTNSEGA